MEYPRTSYINGKTIVLGNTSVNDTEQIDIISSNGTNIKINGIVPSGGGGVICSNGAWAETYLVSPAQLITRYVDMRNPFRLFL